MKLLLWISLAYSLASGLAAAKGTSSVFAPAVSTSTTSSKRASTSTILQPSCQSTPNPNQTPENGVQNGDFNRGYYQCWTKKTNSTRFNAFAILNRGGTAVLNFPKGKVVRSSLSQIVTDLNGDRLVNMNYRLTKGGGCHIRATLPAFGEHDPVFFDQDIQMRNDSDFDSLSGYAFYDPNGPGILTPIYKRLDLIFTCNGSQTSTIWLNGGYLYGID